MGNAALVMLLLMVIGNAALVVMGNAAVGGYGKCYISAL
jgi:hypothetical protein